MDEECREVVKSFYMRRIMPVGNDRQMTLAYEQAPANYVPAAAVTRKERALFGIIGRKGHVGGYVSLV